MAKSLTLPLILLSLLTVEAQGASDSEYLQFIAENGAIVLETYRTPDGDDLEYWGTDRDTYFYKTLDSDLDQTAPFWTKGYFNNDDVPDYVYILFHRTHSEAYVVGFISFGDRYRIVMIEPSSKVMAVETRGSELGHYHLEGHGHGLIWNESEKSFVMAQ